MAFNKQQDRVGTLFQTPFKRVLISNDAYFMQIIYYIHSNPQHHNLVENFINWRWCSYKEILSDRPDNLHKKEVIDWFGSKNAYHDYHNERRIIDEKIKLEDD